jgi:hypothetical protein
MADKALTLTGLIEAAEEALALHGDIPIAVPETGCGCCAGADYEPAATAVESVSLWAPDFSSTTKLPKAFVVR